MSRVQKGFDQLSTVYDLMAGLVYGKSLKKAQTKFLGNIPKDAKVLMLGGGSGWLLVELIKKVSPKDVAYVEISPKMKALAQKKLKIAFGESPKTKIDWSTSDVWQLEPGQSFDVVICPCFLDLFPDEMQAALLEKIEKSCKPEAKMLLTDFRKASVWPMSWISRLLIWIMYRFFRICCGIPAKSLPNFDRHLSAAGWELELEAYFFGGMIQSKLLNRRPKK